MAPDSLSLATKQNKTGTCSKWYEWSTKINYICKQACKIDWLKVAQRRQYKYVILCFAAERETRSGDTG